MFEGECACATTAGVAEHASKHFARVTVAHTVRVLRPEKVVSAILDSRVSFVRRFNALGIVLVEEHVSLEESVHARRVFWERLVRRWTLSLSALITVCILEAIQFRNRNQSKSI